MRRKNIIKKVAAAVMTAVMLFSGAAICEHSVTQQDELVAEAASDDYGSGVVLRAKKRTGSLHVKGSTVLFSQKELLLYFSE